MTPTTMIMMSANILAMVKKLMTNEVALALKQFSPIIKTEIQ